MITSSRPTTTTTTATVIVMAALQVQIVQSSDANSTAAQREISGSNVVDLVTVRPSDGHDASDQLVDHDEWLASLDEGDAATDNSVNESAFVKVRYVPGVGLVKC
jgi:hypothetical protein